MNNEIAPVLDILEELKQECKAISKVQVELRTTIAEQLSNPKGDSIKTQEAVQIHLSKETQAKIKEHQLFVLGHYQSRARSLTQSLKRCNSLSASIKNL